MKKTKFSIFVATSVLALNLLLSPLTTSTFAQTTAPAPEARPVETRDTGDNDNTGLWGLLGLVGLLGLAGRRRTERVHAYTDLHERSRV